MKTIDFSYFIERFNAGEMDQNENVWFTKELEGNLSLQKEVLLRKKTDLILGRQDIVSLRNKLASIEKSRKAEAEKINKGKLHSPGIRYAAVFTGLIVIGSLMFLSFRTENPAKLFKKYYQLYDNPGTTRSPEVINYIDAIEYYNSGQFDKALEGFNAFLKNNPTSPKIGFLSGMAYMEIRKFGNAESSFSNVIDQKINPYTIDANWYLAMCYLATDDKVKAKEQFRNIIKSESIYIKKARRILRHL